MKPRPKITSRYERPFHLLNEDEKAKLHERRDKNELAEHFLVKLGAGRSYGCSCGNVYTTCHSPRQAEASHATHLACVKQHQTERTNAVPDWS